VGGDVETIYARCLDGCGGFVVCTVYLGRDDGAVDMRPMTLAEIARYAPEYTEQVVHSRGAA
jgi:hypothetical protein